MKTLFLKTAGLLIPFLLPVFLNAQQTPYSTTGYDAYLHEIETWNHILRAASVHFDINTPEGLAKLRTFWGGSQTKSVLKPQDRFIPARDGKVRLRIFRPDSIRAVVLDIHGGGFIAGRPESTDSLNDAIARNCKVAVVSVDYRLAPENPFSLEKDDCDTAAAWLLANAKKEFGTDRLILNGYSAGATLGALTLLDIRDKMNGISQVIGINFFYGGFDLGGTPSVRTVKPHSIILDSTVFLQILHAVFKDKSPEELRNPYYSPLYANLKGLPAAFFSVGTIDPLLDDNLFMANRWEAAGNKTTLCVYPECPHAFNLFHTQIAKLANQRVIDWINTLLN